MALYYPLSLTDLEPIKIKLSLARLNESLAGIIESRFLLKNDPEDDESNAVLTMYQGDGRIKFDIKTGVVSVYLDPKDVLKLDFSEKYIMSYKYKLMGDTDFRELILNPYLLKVVTGDVAA